MFHANFLDWFFHENYAYTLAFMALLIFIVWDAWKAKLFRNARECERCKKDLAEYGRELSKLKKENDELENRLYRLTKELMKYKLRLGESIDDVEDFLRDVEK